MARYEMEGPNGTITFHDRQHLDQIHEERMNQAIIFALDEHIEKTAEAYLSTPVWPAPLLLGRHRSSGSVVLAALFLPRKVTPFGFIAKFKGPAEMRSGAGSYAIMPNSSLMKFARATASPLTTHLTLPFRIILTASIPCRVRHAL
jgi:hypothetical protein